MVRHSRYLAANIDVLSLRELDTLARLQHHLSALAALPRSSASRIAALDDYVRVTSTSVTDSDIVTLQAREQALNAMFGCLDDAHRRRIEELPASRDSDTPVRLEIRENEPLIALSR